MFNFTDITKAKSFNEIVEIAQANAAKFQEGVQDAVSKSVAFQRTAFEAIVDNNTKAYEQFQVWAKDTQTQAEKFFASFKA
jgi:hypothetical protein